MKTVSKEIYQLIGQRKRRIEKFENHNYRHFGYLNEAQAIGQPDYEAKRSELRRNAKIVDKVIWAIIRRSDKQTAIDIVNLITTTK